jgi:hypothetical protein
MSDETGVNTMSAVPFGDVGISLVLAGTIAWSAVPGTPTGAEISTSAGAWMTPIVGGVFEPGSRSSSSEREKPYATRAVTATKPIVKAMRAVRDRRFDSIVSTTTTTLSR